MGQGAQRPRSQHRGGERLADPRTRGNVNDLLLHQVVHDHPVVVRAALEEVEADTRVPEQEGADGNSDLRDSVRAVQDVGLGHGQPLG
jgi:hypothetical protein